MAATAQVNDAKTTFHVTDAGPSRKKVAIEVPADTVRAKLREQMDVLAANAALPGFRPGKVPMALIEKRFGANVRREAKQQLVSQAFNEAMADLKLKLVGEPTGQGLDKIELVEGKPFAFELEVEVLPEFEMPSLDGLDVKKPMLEVTDAVVEDELKKVCINEGSLDSREQAEAGDYLTGHAVMKGKDGTEFYNLQGAVVQKPTKDKGGKGMILGIMVDDFDKQLGSPKPGDTLSVKAKGPDHHEVEGIRHNDLTMTFKVDRVDRIIPAKVEDVVKGFGMESEAQLKDAMRQRLQFNVQVQQQGAMHNQVAKHLLDSVKMELPQRLSAQQAARTLERRRLELMYRGVEAHKIEEHMAELRQTSQAAAQRDLKLFFILSRAAEDLGVRVSEQEVNQRIMQIAAQRNMRPDQLRQEIIRTNQVGGIVQQIRDHKTFDAIVAKAKVTEISAEEYNKSMGEKA
jgi:trigger factor